MLASPPSIWQPTVTNGNHNPSLGIPCCGESLLSCHPAGSRAADSGLGIISAHLFNKYLLSTLGRELCWGQGTDQEAQLPCLVSALGSVSTPWQERGCGGGDRCFTALTGLVPSALETTNGLLHQIGQQQMGRDSGQASWRQCFGS